VNTVTSSTAAANGHSSRSTSLKTFFPNMTLRRPNHQYCASYGWGRKVCEEMPENTSTLASWLQRFCVPGSNLALAHGRSAAAVCGIAVLGRHPADRFIST
jgi:hypothetical protein